MRVPTKVMRLVAALGLVLAGVFTLPQPASAAAGDCARGNLCFWVDSGYSGPRYNLGPGSRNANLQNNPCGGCRSGTNPGANGTWNDMASSWYNRQSVPVCLYQNANYSGTAIKIGANGGLSYRASFNDRMSSVRPAIYRSGAGTVPPGYFCF
ncbi:peptidase inhibitor family I36 protein [Actinoplanes sp. LDG1-06]|uniref:Peptidase inhibitor family I36 protein n=1 Tax=Paractinoplanes ovalisporus TaxID=2810368 RepID=A0ABS2A7D3_9ACTN|nr:peptidase inhibitor family I36 protein [Actinoplanes ovalisporus]MBM2615748.1 peptidase inhibitor family I36 protein [Actinoplanes ovalisporus]